MLLSLCFFVYGYVDHRALHSFPTRRSSDLIMIMAPETVSRAWATLPSGPGRRLSSLARKAVFRKSISATGSRQKRRGMTADRKSTRLNSSHLGISYAVFCLKKKKQEYTQYN